MTTTKVPLDPNRLREDLPLLADLPAFPPVLAQLSATLGREDVGLADVEDIIHRDPVIAARLVSAANAVIYADHAPVTSVRGALLRLGLVRVRRLAMLISLYNAVPRRDALGDRFWRHSLAVAHAVEALGQFTPTGTETTERITLGALLHDIGILVVATHYPKAHAAVAAAMTEHSMGWCEAEAAVLGMDHGEVGACLGEHWGLTPAVLSAIRYHHRAAAAPVAERGIASLLRLAEAVSNGDPMSSLGEGGELQADDPALAEIGITADRLASALAQAKGAARSGASLLEGLR